MADEEEKKPENPELAGDEAEVLEFEFNEDPEGSRQGGTYGAGGEESDLVRKIQKLKSDLKACQREKEEFLTGWQKERADFANYRKQEDDRRANFSESVRERILGRFLTVLDSFNMAFANKEAWNKVEENWRKGVEYIYSQFGAIFEEYGVKEIGEVGENFDPGLHQSIEMTPTAEKENNHKISEVVQKGYKLGERIIRPARVKVYEYKGGGN